MKLIFNFIFKFIKAEQGVVALAVALSLPLLLGLVGMSVDGSYWLKDKRNLQTAADAASISGAFELSNNGTEAQAEDAALLAAEANGYESAKNGNFEIVFGEDDEGNPTVRVDLAQDTELWFSQIFVDGVTVAAHAISKVDGTTGPFCFLSLNQTADDAIRASGNVEVQAEKCGIADNSASSSALHLWGSVLVNVGDVKVVGDYVVGGSSEFNYSKLRTHASSTKDPYSSLSVGSHTSCTKNQQSKNQTKISGNGTYNLTPGTFCGGISVTGNNTINLAPGTYYMDGGDFSVSGGGSITGTDVTIVLTNSGGTSYGTYGNLDITGGKTTYLKAPTTGPYAGVAVFQDRNTPPSSVKENRLMGTAGLTLDGVVYTPKRGLTFGGNGAAYSPAGGTCSKLIADTITFSGNPYVGNNCDDKGTLPIGTAGVTLIE